MKKFNILIIKRRKNMSKKEVDVVNENEKIPYTKPTCTIVDFEYVDLITTSPGINWTDGGEG